MEGLNRNRKFSNFENYVLLEKLRAQCGKFLEFLKQRGPLGVPFFVGKKTEGLEIFRTVFWKLRIIGKIEGTV